MRKLFLIVFLAFLSAPLRAASTLDVYFIDVEGGQATLFVTPAGKSMLVDTGWPGFNGRDADRIVSVAKAAGVTRLDYVVITHFHMDHVGGVPQLAERIPIATFVDHGHSVETGKEADDLFHAYVQARDRASHLIVRAGDKIPLEDVEVRVVASTGQAILRPLAGAGQPNPLCATTKPREVDPSENAQSIGMLITYGKFRMIDLGDLTWNKELALVCPNNKLGTVDVYLSTHHGLDLSNAPAIVHALKPGWPSPIMAQRKAARPRPCRPSALRRALRTSGSCTTPRMRARKITRPTLYRQCGPGRECELDQALGRTRRRVHRDQ